MRNGGAHRPLGRSLRPQMGYRNIANDGQRDSRRSRRRTARAFAPRLARERHRRREAVVAGTRTAGPVVRDPGAYRGGPRSGAVGHGHAHAARPPPAPSTGPSTLPASLLGELLAYAARSRDPLVLDLSRA